MFAWLKDVFKPVFVFFCEDYIYSQKAGVGFAANKSNMCETYQFDLKIYLYPYVLFRKDRVYSKEEGFRFPANKSNMCEGRSDGGNGEPCSGNLGL